MIKDNYLITILADVFINILSMENIQEKTKRMIFGVSFDTTEIHSLLVSNSLGLKWVEAQMGIDVPKRSASYLQHYRRTTRTLPILF